jgi:hypothetical protein
MNNKRVQNYFQINRVKNQFNNPKKTMNLMMISFQNKVKIKNYKNHRYKVNLIDQISYINKTKFRCIYLIFYQKKKVKRIYLLYYKKCKSFSNSISKIYSSKI